MEELLHPTKSIVFGSIDVKHNGHSKFSHFKVFKSLLSLPPPPVTPL